jgi:sugar lactone lactonase YvrE
MNAQRNLPLKRAAKMMSLAVLVLLSFLFTGTLTHANNIYVSNWGSNPGFGYIEDLESSGNGSVFSSIPEVPTGLAFDSSANLYVTGDFAGGAKIEKFNSNGQATVFATSGLYAPKGLAFDGAGNLYVANTGPIVGDGVPRGTIVKFGTNGFGSVFASSLDLPDGLAFDSSGNLYLSCGGTNGTIVKFGGNGIGSVFASGLSRPNGLAFDSSGNLYVGCGDANTIEKFDANGNGSVFASSVLADPVGLAFDGDGNLYVANFQGNTISKFDVSGNGSVFSNSGLNAPTFIALQIPEPAGWTLVMIGVIALTGRRLVRRPLS